MSGLQSPCSLLASAGNVRLTPPSSPPTCVIISIICLATALIAAKLLLKDKPNANKPSKKTRAQRRKERQLMHLMKIQEQKLDRL